MTEQRRKKIKDYRCPTCFKRWSVEEDFSGIEEVPRLEQENCDYCAVSNRTSLETLHRMVEVLPMASVYDYPKVMEQLMKHVVLKE